MTLSRYQEKITWGKYIIVSINGKLLGLIMVYLLDGTLVSCGWVCAEFSLSMHAQNVLILFSKEWQNIKWSYLSFSEWEKEKQIYIHLWASLMTQIEKNLPAMRETWVWSLGWEDTLEKRMATHSSILAWERGVGGLQFMGSQRVRYDWGTNTLTYIHVIIHIHIYTCIGEF